MQTFHWNWPKKVCTVAKYSAKKEKKKKDRKSILETKDADKGLTLHIFYFWESDLSETNNQHNSGTSNQDTQLIGVPATSMQESAAILPVDESN